MYECGVSVPDDKRLFKLVSMSGALEELLVLNKKILDIQLHELVSRHGAKLDKWFLVNYCFPTLSREDVFLRAAQMEQIVEKVRIQSPFQVIVHHSLHIIKFIPSFSGAALNTGVTKISVYFYEQFYFFKGWKLTNTVCFTSRS
ncbi:hypothetical protein HID58_084225 [Brassica napus]|uniref:Uncharacterized protein n=1 Tax=Brassica napus TaxID=3708 RepID=A0ABQ7XJ31_BRANA|nr:hypothetical protein HID58_084225 [Brassica napus]